MIAGMLMIGIVGGMIMLGYYQGMSNPDSVPGKVIFWSAVAWLVLWVIPSLVYIWYMGMREIYG